MSIFKSYGILLFILPVIFFGEYIEEGLMPALERVFVVSLGIVYFFLIVCVLRILTKKADATKLPVLVSAIALSGTVIYYLIWRDLSSLPLVLAVALAASVLTVIGEVVFKWKI